MATVTTVLTGGIFVFTGIKPMWEDEANKFGGENAAAFGGGGLFGDIFYKDDEEDIIEKVPDTSDDLLNDLLHEIGQDFGGLGRLLLH